MKGEKMENIIVYSCKNCNKKLNANEKKCPFCGNVGRQIELLIREDILISESRMNVKIKNKETGRLNKKYIVDEASIRKEQCYDSGKDVERYIRINRRDNIYKEVVTDTDTGEVIHKTEESLKEHIGHGSAKYVK